MKIGQLMILAVVVACPLTLMAANDRSENRSTQYKCYFIMEDGTELVNYMMSKDDYAKQLQLEMTGKTIYAKDGVSKRRVQQSIECVPGDKEFESFTARQLDKKTLK